MSLSLAIAANVLLGIALLGGLAYAMSQANRLTPHIPAPVAPSSSHERGALKTAALSPLVRDTREHHASREKVPA